MAVPKGQFMNKEGKFWLTERDAGLASFTGTEEHIKRGVFTKGTYTYQSKEKDSGYWFTEPRFVVLETSPRFIELYDTKEKTTSLVGFYDSEEGQKLYQSLKNKDSNDFSATLRTFYAVLLLDDKLEPLVARPLVVPVKGIAAVYLGNSLFEFRQSIEASYAKACNRRLAMPLPVEYWYNLAVYHPTLAKEILGSNGNDICIPETFERLDPSKWVIKDKSKPLTHTHPLILSGDFGDEVREMNSLYAGSFRMYIMSMAQKAGFHKVNPNSPVASWLNGNSVTEAIAGSEDFPSLPFGEDVEGDSGTTTLAPEANGIPVRSR